MNELSTREFIHLISKRPGMYVFSGGITELHGLVRGFSYGREENLKGGVLELFTKWLKTEKYPVFAEFNVSWCRILLFNESCEKHALDNFFELWFEFEESIPD